jgi:trk system potassium uptake protein TrkA
MLRLRPDNTQRVVVIGLGRFGRSAARTLHELGYGVTAIDLDEQNVAEVANYVSVAAQGDGSSEELLRSLEVNRAEVGIVGQGRNLEANLLSTLLLKRLGVPWVVAKATSDLHSDLLRRVGADRVVFPERDEGVRLAHALAVPSINDYISLSPTSGVAKFTAPPGFIGKTLAEVHSVADVKLTVLLIKRGNLLLCSPSRAERIQPGDQLVVAGPDTQIEAFVETPVPESEPR